MAIMTEERVLKVTENLIKRFDIIDEDIIQDIYSNVLEIIGKEYSTSCYIVVYKRIETILKNKNKNQKYSFYTFQQAEQEGFIQPSSESIDIIETRIAIGQYLSHVNTLTEREIRVLVLRYCYGFTLKETAIFINKSEARVMQIERKALRRIRCCRWKYWFN